MNNDPCPTCRGTGVVRQGGGLAICDTCRGYCLVRLSPKPTTLPKPASQVGQIGTLTLGRLKVRVRVLKTRINYGQLQLRVRPVSGAGEAWIAARRLEAEK
jgi:hypothetical protein